jgi:hypothetical protein
MVEKGRTDLTADTVVETAAIAVTEVSKEPSTKRRTIRNRHISTA